MSLVRLIPDRSLASASVASGASATARTYPAICRRVVIPPRYRGSSRHRLPTCEWVTMWTSIAPEPRIVLAPMPGPVSRASSQDRRLAPSTSWVAFSALAKVSSASEMFSPTTWW